MTGNQATIHKWLGKYLALAVRKVAEEWPD